MSTPPSGPLYILDHLLGEDFCAAQQYPMFGAPECPSAPPGQLCTPWRTPPGRSLGATRKVETAGGMPRVNPLPLNPQREKQTKNTTNK